MFKVKLDYKYGLYFTSLTLHHNGKIVFVDNIIIDTGCSQTIIAAEYFLKIAQFNLISIIDTSYDIDGNVHGSILEIIDKIEIQNCFRTGVKLGFGTIDPKLEINGLVGLDVLKCFQASIDTENDMLIIKA